VRALIVGVGSIGARHLRNLRALCPNSVILALRPTHPTLLPPGADAVVDSISTALREPLDLALICTPAPTHLSYAESLLAAEVPVLIEKPISDRVAGVPRLLRLAQESKRTLMVGYPLRFHAGLASIEENLRSGGLGEIHSLRAEVGQWLPDWRPGSDHRGSISADPQRGGGVLLELSHEFDLARHLLGEVRGIAAQTRSSRSLGLSVEDHAEVLLDFECGALGSLRLDMLRSPPERRVEVWGSEGRLELDFRRGVAARWNSRGEREQLWSGDPRAAFDAMYVEELDHFLTCVESESTPRCGGGDGLAALRWVRAAARSARCGRTLRP